MKLDCYSVHDFVKLQELIATMINVFLGEKGYKGTS